MSFIGDDSSETRRSFGQVQPAPKRIGPPKDIRRVFQPRHIGQVFGTILRDLGTLKEPVARTFCGQGTMNVAAKSC